MDKKNNPSRKGDNKRKPIRQDDLSDEDSKSSVEEAQEEHIDVAVQDDDKPISEQSGEDLENNLGDDYRNVPELDRYEEDGLDDEDYSQLDEEEKRRVDELLQARRRIRDRGGARQRGLIELSEDSDDLNLNRDLRRRLYDEKDMDGESFVFSEAESGEEDQLEREDERYLDVDQCRGNLHSWIQEPRTTRFIQQTFKKFLLTFRNEKGMKVYDRRISEMCENNHQSFEVEYFDLNTFNNTLAVWVAYEPLIIFPYLNEIAYNIACQNYHAFHDVQSEIFVQITNFPILDSIRELRHQNLNQLIKVIGVVTRRSLVLSQLKKAYYLCKCGDKKGPIFYDNPINTTLGACVVCQSKGPFSVVSEESVYRNFQKITLQESPGSVQPGRVPRQKEVILLGDNIDVARPGDEVQVTGVYTHRYDYALNVKHGFPIFQTLIEANNIKRTNESESIQFPQQDIDEIKKLARQPDIAQVIIDSVAPSIYGHRDIQTAIALSMFGGVHKDVNKQHKIRGDINVLVLGDPGTAKSQFLQTVEKTFHRCVYTTGKGASAVGLTASVQKDASTGEWVLEGGALVLADKGICLIDEFDKMNDYDRTSIHEAMEQQSISISKAGIVTTLQARCAVIACANPLGGRYKSENSFMDNVDLTDPILSRFDVLCVVQDQIDNEIDDRLATFVINNHIQNHPNLQRNEKNNPEDPLIDLHRSALLQEKNETKQTIPQDLLRKYIIYARQNCHPQINGIDQDQIIKFYTDLRQESQNSGGMNIAVRHIQSIIRLAEAHAKMHLREQVAKIDVDTAISVMLQSFVCSQQVQTAKTIRQQFLQYIVNPEDNYNYMRKIIDSLFIEQQQYLIAQGGDPSKAFIMHDDVRTATQSSDPAYYSGFYQSKVFQTYYQLDGNQIIAIN